MCFLAYKFRRKTAVKFQKCFCVTLFQKVVTDYHLNDLGLSDYKRIKRNLEFIRKKQYFKKHLLTNVHQNVLPRMMEWLRQGAEGRCEQRALQR